MDMRQAHPGQHLKAADLGGQTITLTIAAVAMAKVGDDEKPVMKFYETQQDLVLNKTNTGTLIDAYGPESQGWLGRQVQLFPTKAQFGAEMVDAIRVQTPAAGAAIPPPAVAPAAAPAVGGYAAPGMPPQAQQPAPVAPAQMAPAPAGYPPAAPAPGMPPQVQQPAPVAPAAPAGPGAPLPPGVNPLG